MLKEARDDVVLGIGDDEFLATVGIGVDGVELRIESLHTVG